jgi:hypothetical protein
MMARDTLGYQYIGDGDLSRMPVVKSMTTTARVHALPSHRVLGRPSAERGQ